MYYLAKWVHRTYGSTSVTEGDLQHQVGQSPRLSELPQHLVFCNVKCWVPDGIERGDGTR